MNRVAARVEHIEAEAWAQLQLALPAAAKDELKPRIYRQGGAVWLATPGADVAAVNRVVGLGFDQALTASQLTSIHEWFTDADVGRWVIEWSPEAQPTDAARLFAQRGAAARTPTVKLYRELTAVLETEESRHPLEIREIGPEEAVQFETTVADPLGVPSQAAPGIRSTVGHPGWHFYLAIDDGEPIAGAALFVLGEGAWFGLAATAARARRRGAQTALLHRRLRDASQFGCRWGSAETHPATEARPNPSLRNMLGVGFQVLYHRPKYLFDEGATSSASRPSA